MTCDIAALRHFYKTSLGQLTVSFLRPIIESSLNSQEKILGIGYPIPYFDGFPCFSFMPAQQGAIAWPHASSRTALIDESCLPLPDESMDCVVLIHALENAYSVHTFLREVWRILKSNGRLVVVVTNRHSMWACFETTPFGQGHPFTLRQLSSLLQETQFSPLSVKRGLYMPPLQANWFHKTASMWETVGSVLLKKVSGVLVLESIKQVYMLSPTRYRRPVLLEAYSV